MYSVLLSRLFNDKNVDIKVRL